MNFSAISSQGLIGKILRSPLSLIPKNSALPILQGGARGKKWIVGSHDHGCWLGSYEYKKRKLFESSLRKGDCVYDVGAHVGYYSVIASCVVGEKGLVYCFEPLPANICLLYRHITLNSLRNVIVVPTAVSDTNGSALFEENAGSAVGHISPNGSIAVPLVSLDQFVKNSRVPTHLKIDVEGAEFMVLVGAEALVRKFSPVIFLATHSAKLGIDCLSLLKSWGYSVTSLSHDEHFAEK